MRVRFALISLCWVTALGAQEAPVDLPGVTVYSERVALQEPAATFAMPVTALRFEPLVDVQGRNSAEAQSDIAIRGGTFENTGFRIGALSLYDPETGHFFPEIPIAPAMLSTPDILTGADNAWRGWNANAGTVAYQFRPIRSAGFVSVGAGEYSTYRGELYQGVKSAEQWGGQSVAFDADVAASQSDGSRPWGESKFFRADARLELTGKTTQTDVLYGYQSKDYGWPDLYTPFPNINETDDVQTNLFLVNHHVDLGSGDYVSVGGYFRENHDHYVFNRTDPGAFFAPFPTLPAFHKTWVYAAGAEGVVTWSDVRWNLSAFVLDDELHSTTLIYGPYHSRNYVKLSVVPEKRWTLKDGSEFSARAGATYDDSNRNASAVSPVAEIALDHVDTPAGRGRFYASFARTTQTPTYFAIDSNSAGGLFRGNPNLGRESSRNFEVGSALTSGSWTTTAAVFYRKDNDLVDWTYSFASTNARAANAVDIGTTGFELVTRYTSPVWDVVFGYTALHKDPNYGMATVDASFYALNYPEQRVTLAITGRIARDWEIRVDNEFRVQDPNALRTSTSHPFISSAGLFYTVRPVRGLKLSLEAENLWNSNYQTVPAVPSARRQLMFGATYIW